jgi:hypothetical protein
MGEVRRKRYSADFKAKVALEAIAAAGEDYSTQRLSQRYRFTDPNMDLFFLGALGWAPAGGISAGEAFQVSTMIEDGDAGSWASAFEAQGETLIAQADQWVARGETRAAGETRLRAFTCFRLAWQFVAPGNRFLALFRRSQYLFDVAMEELDLPSERFAVPYGGSTLPGHFSGASDPSAPTIPVIGGADTCHEDRFLSQGRYYIERGTMWLWQICRDRASRQPAGFSGSRKPKNPWVPCSIFSLQVTASTFRGWPCSARVSAAISLPAPPLRSRDWLR